MRITLNQDLDHLHKDIIDMSTLVEHSIEDTIQALKKQDVELARSIMKGDDAVDAAEGQMCIRDSLETRRKREIIKYHTLKFF